MDRLPKYNKGAEEVRNAPHGTRNDTLNEAASTETLKSGDTEPLKEATRANGVPRDEVRATIASAKAGAKDALRNPKNIAAAVASPDWGTRDFSGLLVRERGDRLMVVEYDAKPSPKRPFGGRDARTYVVNPATGLWADEEVVLREWLTEIARKVVLSAFEHLEGEQALAALKESKRLKDTTVNEAIRRIPDVMRGADRDERVVEADMRDLDRPGRYLGTASGVVDLETGSLLHPEEGRKHKVTRSTGVRLPDEAEDEHEDVEALMAHYPTDVAAYVWRWFGRSLWGQPPQELLMFVGSAKYGHKGKTTIKETILAAMGGYAGTLPETMMRPRAEAGPTPELHPAVEKRLLISEECTNWRFDAERFKALTAGGGATFPVEPNFQAIQDMKATASLVLMANEPPHNLPRDPALLKRLRYVELQRPPEIREDLRTDSRFPPHVLARMIREASTCQPPHTAEAPSHVRQVTKAKIAELLGALHVWVQEAVQRGDGNLGRRTLWETWAKVHKADPQADVIAGARENHLRDVILSLYGQKIVHVKEDGRTVRGWKRLGLTADVPPPGAPAGTPISQGGMKPAHLELEAVLRTEHAGVEKRRAQGRALLKQQGETDPELSSEVLYDHLGQANTLRVEMLPMPVRVRVAILNRQAEGLRLLLDAMQQGEPLADDEIEVLGGAGHITKTFMAGVAHPDFPLEEADTNTFVRVVREMRLDARETLAARKNLVQRAIDKVLVARALMPKERRLLH